MGVDRADFEAQATWLIAIKNCCNSDSAQPETERARLHEEAGLLKVFEQSRCEAVLETLHFGFENLDRSFEVDVSLIVSVVASPCDVVLNRFFDKHVWFDADLAVVEAVR